ncbi:MAG: hypothetical protein QXP60_02460 [Nitrososphaerota archaeon]
MIIKAHCDSCISEKFFFQTKNEKYIKEFLNSILIEDQVSYSKYVSTITRIISFLSHSQTSPTPIFLIFIISLFKNKHALIDSPTEKFYDEDSIPTHINYSVELVTILGKKIYNDKLHASSFNKPCSNFKISGNSSFFSSTKIFKQTSLGLSTFIDSMPKLPISFKNLSEELIKDSLLYDTKQNNEDHSDDN